MKRKQLSVLDKTIYALFSILFLVCIVWLFLTIRPTKEKIGFLISIILSFVMILAAPKMVNWLMLKKTVDWTNNRSCIDTFYCLLVIPGFLFSSTAYILFYFEGILISYKICIVLLFSACFSISFFSCISMLYAKKYATILTRIALASAILYALTLLILTPTEFESIKSINGYDILLILMPISPAIMGCQGLIRTFRKAWRAQFTNQSYPFFIIWIGEVLVLAHIIALIWIIL